MSDVVEFVPSDYLRLSLHVVYEMYRDEYWLALRYVTLGNPEIQEGFTDHPFSPRVMRFNITKDEYLQFKTLAGDDQLSAEQWSKMPKGVTPPAIPEVA